MDDQDRYVEKGEQYASQDRFLQTHTPIPELDEEKESKLIYVCIYFYVN